MKKIGYVLALAFAFGLVACGDDSSSGPKADENTSLGSENGTSENNNSGSSNNEGYCIFTESGNSFTVKFNDGTKNETYTQSGEKVTVTMEFFKGTESMYCGIYTDAQMYVDGSCNGNIFTAELNPMFGDTYDKLKKQQKTYCETGVLEM